MNNINVISPGSQEHRINMSISGIENQMSLLEHINTNNSYNVGDHIIVETGAPPLVVAHFRIIKGLQELNFDTDNENDSLDHYSDSGSNNDDDSVRPLGQSNNAMTPIPTSGLRFADFVPRNRTIIPRGGKMTRKRRHMKSKHSRIKKKVSKKKRKSRRCIRKK